MFARLLAAILPSSSLAYNLAKRQARDEDAAVRGRLAASPDTRPEILYFLADDPAPEVRRALAANEATPRQADVVLAEDADADVRAGLAVKIARLAPSLGAAEQDRVRALTYKVLETLARDQATRVRRILAETLKDMIDAPGPVIGRLARDAELVVSAPVLENSPILADEDLVEIIASRPMAGAIAAISRRRNLSGIVADFVVGTDDVDAIAELLSNETAQIREATLDRLVERAADVEPWHEPLVRRPRLSQAATVRLARFISDTLIERLLDRRDVDEETAAAVRAVVERRLDENDLGPERSPSRPAGARDVERAKDMLGKGQLTPDAIARAAQESNRAFVEAALAVLADVPVGVVQRILQAHSAKGVFAMLWRAGLPPALAVPVQRRFAGLAPPDVVEPTAGSAFPLSEDEMHWQLDFYRDLAQRPTP